MNNKYLILALCGLVGLFGGLFIHSQFVTSNEFGGLVHNVQEIFRYGLKAGSSATEVINSSGEWVGAIDATSLSLDSGTTINSFNCTTVSVNPTAVASSTVVTATTTLAGALGDAVISSSSIDLSGLALDAYMSDTNVVTYLLSQPDYDAASVDLATTTIKMCKIGF